MSKSKRESTIENNSCKFAKSLGWLNYKFSSPQHRGVPDRIFIKLAIVIFVEFKAEGEEPTPFQELTIDKMKANGARVYVCDSEEAFKRLLLSVNAEAEDF